MPFHTTASATRVTRRSGPGVMIAAMALAVGIAAMPAEAGQIAPLKIGNWSGGAYSDDRTGAFSHCAASASYRSGVSLLFSVSGDETWSMGFSSESWSLIPGQRYPVRYRVDNGTVLEGVAVARNPKLAQVHLPANNRLFQHFRKGNTLRVGAARQVLEFRLTDTSKMLARLRDCARHFIAGSAPDPFAPAGTASADPFSGERAPGRPGPTDASRQEAATVARLLLESASLRFEPMGPQDNRTLWTRNDAIWRMPGLFGALRVIPDASASSAAIKAGIVSSDAESCNGRYATGTVAYDRNSLRDFYTACDSGSGDDLALYYALLPRKSGGFYLVTVAGKIADAKRIRAAGTLIVDAATGSNRPAPAGQEARFTY